MTDSVPFKIKFEEAIFVGKYVESMKELPQSVQNMVYTFSIEAWEHQWIIRKKYSDIKTFLKCVLFSYNE